MKLYQSDAGDPQWLQQIAQLHGHLGPWLTIGGLIGRDALQRLNTPGQWKIHAVCWMPPEKQRTPFTCLLDGLQFTSGATMGKRNIEMTWSQLMGNEDQPVIFMMRHGQPDRPAEGAVYRMKDVLRVIMQSIDPERLEEISRDLTRYRAADLFEIEKLDEQGCRDLTATIGADHA